MQKKLNFKKSAVLLTSLVLVMTAVVGGTLAFLLDTAGPVENTFTPSEVPIEVWEDVKNGYKENVQIKNTGNVDAYIRAKVLVNWVTTGDDGNKYIVPESQMPAGYGKDISYGTDGWKYNEEDGFYYYTSKVGSQVLTNNLINVCEMTYNGEGAPQYELQVDIIAQSIQAEPENVVLTEWGVNPESLAGPVEP